MLRVEYKDGTPVEAGDIIFLADRNVGDTPETSDSYEVIYDHGCLGVYTQTRFHPLFEFQIIEIGEYVSNMGNAHVYTGKYNIWKAK